MASNLAAQLSAIAATSTNTLNTQKLKSIHSVSLLFPPSVAAAQDTDTIFSIAIEGFRELCQLDRRFLLYEKGLFSEHSKNVDRFVLSQTSAESLSKSIDGFLQLLCGRMLLQPALRALEWLVRQFRVQDQNTASLILCFLPYHDHPTLFKTMLSILRQKDLPREFVFLIPYLKRPLPVPKHVITHALSHHRDLLTLLCDHTTNAVSTKRDSHQLVSFFSVAITASVSLMCDSLLSNKSGRAKNVPTAENILTCTLPLLDQAFSARSSPELETGCHMLTIVLVTKLSLTDIVLTAIIKSIVNHWTVGSYKTGLTCVAYIAQSRFRDDVELPDEVISALLKLDKPEFGNRGLDEALLSMQVRYRVDRLVVALCLGILKRLGETHNAKGLRIVISLLERANMESHQRLLVTKKLVEVAQKVGSTAMSGGNADEIRELLAGALVDWAGPAREGKTGKSLTQAMADVIDVDDLEMRLQTVIRPLPAALLGPAKKAIKETSVQAQKLEDILPTIPSSTGEKTVLAPEAKTLFQDLLRFFVAAVLSGRQEEFIELQLFKGLPPDNPLQISFLIECWTSYRYPVSMRSSALEVCAKVIQRQASKSVSIDYQAVLPHILIALADPNRRVRSDAVDLTKVLFEHYKGLQQPVLRDRPSKKKRKRSSGAVPYWGLGAIYGEGKDSDEVRWLELDQAIKLMEQITANDLFGCIEDPEYIGNVLAIAVGTGEGIGSSLKGSLKRSIFVFLSSHAVNVPGLEIRYRLLSQINKINLAGDIRTRSLLPALTDWLSVEDYNERVKQCQTERLDIVAIEKQMIKVVNADKPKILIDILTKDVSCSLLEAAADRIGDIWSAIELDVQIEIATGLLEIELDVAQDFSGVDVLERLRIPTAAFQQFFDKARTQLQVFSSHISVGPGGKGRRSDGMSNEAKVEEQEAARRRATVVTDLLYAQGAERHRSLLKSLFGILADLAGSHFSGMAYLNQVLLDCMSSIVTNIQRSGDSDIDDSVRPDVLVECIRAAAAPQVQNRAILLLANLADVVPERVQHSVMPIFTFMGANTLRRDDEYSAFVIEQTIKRIIPPLVKSLQSQEGNKVAGIAELVKTFAASYSHIPSHRRVRLFVALTKTLGAEEFLFAVIAKLGEKYLSTNAEHPTGEEAVVTSACKMIVESFDIDVQLETVNRYLDLVMEVLRYRKHGLPKHLFEIAKSDKYQLAERLLNLLFIVIGNKKLQDYIAKVDDDGDMYSKKFSGALERVLGPLELGSESCVYEPASRVLSCLLYGLRIPRFIPIVEHLIFNPESDFRGGALRIFRDRLSNIHRIDSASAKAIVCFAPKISTLISAHDPDELSIDAIVCVTSIIKHCQSEMPPVIANIADAVAGHGGLYSSDDSTQAVSLECLTNLAAKFKVHLIPILPKAVPRTLELLREGLRAEREVLHNHAIAFLEELVKNLPGFMTSWLEKIMRLMYSSAASIEEEHEVDVRVGFLKTIGQKMQLDSVIRVYTVTWDQAIEGGDVAIEEALITLEEMESSSKGDEKRSKATKRLFRTTDSLKPLLNLVLLLLDLRRRFLDLSETEDIEEERIQGLEDQALKVILKFVYRLNHGNFKPMFLRIIEWASEDLSKGSDTSINRCIALWNFLYLLGSDLESIFTSYFGFALDNAVDILTNDTIFTTHSPLWKSTLKALHVAFKSDDHDFWQSPTTFGKIAPVLTAQLARAATSAPVVREYVYPALTELVGAIQGSEEHARVINGKVLEQMKAEDVMVRIAAAEALKDIYAQVGEEWLNFLPESVPIIAELMEDEEEGVETAAHLLVLGIERHLGEGELQAMFT
ncbi:armadillo-type protein [Tuber brumale]|nr:armadillo-type protein [Tuber brumale]